LKGILANILTILDTHDDIFDVLADICIINVAFAVAVLFIHLLFHHTGSFKTYKHKTQKLKPTDACVTDDWRIINE